MWMLHPLPVGADNSALHPLRFKCGHLWLKKKWIWLLNHYEASNGAHQPSDWYCGGYAHLLYTGYVPIASSNNLQMAVRGSSFSVSWLWVKTAGVRMWLAYIIYLIVNSLAENMKLPTALTVYLILSFTWIDECRIRIFCRIFFDDHAAKCCW